MSKHRKEPLRRPPWHYRLRRALWGMWAVFYVRTHWDDGDTQPIPKVRA